MIPSNTIFKLQSDFNKAFFFFLNLVTCFYFLGEVKVLDTFYTMLSSDPSRAFYGYRHVAAANEAQAIETLLIGK